MRVRFVGAPGALPPTERRRLEQRLRLAVGRRAPDVERVEVSLMGGGDEPGAAGLHRCRIRARLVTGSQLLVDELAGDADAAVSAATWRLDRWLQRGRRRAGS